MFIEKMNLSLLVAVSSIVVLASCAAAPPNAHYNRRAYPPPKFFYSHKYSWLPSVASRYCSGPPINKYRPPGFRATRNPYIGPGSGQGIQHQGLPAQGIPQVLHQGPPQGLYQGRPPGFRATRNPYIGPGPGQGIQHQGLPAQGIPQVLHQGPPQGLYQGVPQGIHQGPLGFNQGAPHGLHQVSQHQGVHHPLAQAPHPGHPYQQVPHQSQLFQSSPAKRFTPTPQTFVKTSPIPQFTSIAPWKIQPSHLNSIKNDLISEAPSFTVATKTYYKPDDERSPIHTIPAPKLSPADKPADFEYRIQQQTTQQQYSTTPGFKTLDKAIANQIKMNPAALLAQQTQSHFAPDPDPQHVPQVRIPPTTPGFKTLDKAIANQIKINPAALLAQQTQSHFAPDPDPQHVPQVRIPPTSDPFSQPSNGQVPIDIYLQQQIDNEIAQQEALYIQQQRAKEAIQYQQQLEAAQLAIAQQQAFHAQQENLKQQLLQQQALEAQKQLALQAQQQAAQQAVLQQQQQQQIYQEVPVQQQSSESLTAEELFNLMHGIPAKNQAGVQASTQSVQDVLSVPQQQNNEIASAATTNFQPNYQSFNYDEKAHQQQIQVEQQKEYSEGSESKRSTSEGVAQTNFNPQYQNFNYDEKTKRNGFNNGNNEVGVQSQLQVDEVTQNTTKVDPKDIKKEKRYQKNAFSASHGYTVGYSTLPKDITESVPQTQFNLQQGGYSTLPVNYNEKQISRKVKPDNAVVNEIKKVHSGHLKKKTKYHNNGYSTIAEDLLQQHDLKNDLQQLTYSTLPNQKILEVLKHQRHFNSTQQQDQQTVTTEKDTLQKMRENAQKFYNPHILQAVRNNTGSDNVQIQQSIQIYENNYASKGDDNHIDLSGITTTSTTTPASTPVSTTSESSVVTEINVIESNHDSDNQESNLYEEIMLQDKSKPLEDHYNILQQQQQQQIYQEVPVQQQSSESLTAEELFNLMHGIPAKNQADVQASTQSVQDVLSVPQQQNNEIASAATTNFQPNYQSFNYDEKAHQQQIQVEQQKEYSEGSESKRSTSEGVAQTNFNPQYQNFNYDEKTKRNGFNNGNNEVGVQSQLQVDEVTQNTTKVDPKDIKKEKRYQKNAFSASHGYTVGYSTLPKDITESVPQTQFNLQQGGYSTLPVNYNEKQISRKVKPDNAVVNEIKKVHSGHLKKKTKYHNNGYSTIAEDLLQQHDLKNDLQQLTYSTLPNQKILEVLKHQRHFNSTQQQDQQTVTTEKDTLQKMRENAQKFYNPHILQAVRNNTGSDNVQIQQSIQIYENNYASKGDDNHIDLSGITTTSTTTPASTPVSTTSESSVVTEINVIESNHDSDNQESNLYEEIMLQDKSKPLEDHYNSNSHSYFGQRIRPKRT
ncbi:LOW QUALITY PROTEIN: myb-like protein P [Diaphorina citri]|uniref:LOW QUALITY PROTEIN: myb-like protein P n=1 Tax=Diaphorina citri TaxID=121845 RepID=A0A3Q0J3F7_DIACI|nr:LOW QUALITY PROTEIN: myb-like protein P [Diaphorina citri]